MSRFWFVCACYMLCACQPESRPAISFYYWKTVFALSDKEQSVIERNRVKHVYLRYFDVVVKNGEAVPESPIEFDSQPENLEVTPVVYIRNEVMLETGIDVNRLAEKIVGLITQISETAQVEMTDIQIDCDWSVNSRERYFSFIESVRSISKLPISATIRLHQIKYVERTGVPPVDKGILMYYNMGRIGADASNSIYERSTASRYLDRLSDYPLPLEVALPIFSWGVHIRNNKVVGLVRDARAEILQTDRNFRKMEGQFFEIVASCFKKGIRFQKGDRIKIENVTPDNLEDMSRDLGSQIKMKPSEIILYDLNEINLNAFKNETLLFEKVTANF